MKNVNDDDYLSFEDVFPEDRLWFSPKEAGEIIGRSDQFVRNSIHCGRIFGHVANGATPKGEEKRCYMRVHKSMLKLYLLETANYTSTMFIDGLNSLLDECNDYQLFSVEKHLKELLYGKRQKNLR